MSPAQLQPVPPLNLAANFAEIRDEALEEVREILESGFYVLGPKVQAFEQAFAEYCGSPHALGVSSGTDAILLALMALDIGPGDEVIVPAFTFFCTGGCVSRLGATPVFCDIDPATFNLDLEDVRRRITPKTKAVMPVHLYGRVAELDPLLDVAAQHGLFIVEDAAQAVGGQDQLGRTAGTIGTFGAISFYPTKNLGAAGDAGALLCGDAALHDKATKLRLHGETQRYHHKYIGGNFRIDALQAALLRLKLKHLDAWVERRREVAHVYTQLFTSAGLAGEHVTLPEEGPGRHVYHQYVLRCPRRDELVEHLKSRQIGFGIYYPVPLHLQECFADLGGKAGDLPHAEQAAKEVLALPMYPELTKGQQESVVAAVGEFYRA